MPVIYRHICARPALIFGDSTKTFEKWIHGPVATSRSRAIETCSAEVLFSLVPTPCYNRLANEGVAGVASNELIEVPALRSAEGIFHPSTDFQREEVRNQLRQILASTAFQNSKRYAAVLTYIVEQTLAGFGDRLKERTIGIEVFQRAATYDTAADHVVRSAAREVRKRLVQYYQVNAYCKLIIDVLPGSYVPQFRWVADQPILPAATPDAVSPARNPYLLDPIDAQADLDRLRDFGGLPCVLGWSVPPAAQ